MKQDTYLHILKKGNINIKKKARGINKTSASKYLISEHLEKKKNSYLKNPASGTFKVLFTFIATEKFD